MVASVRVLLGVGTLRTLGMMQDFPNLTVVHPSIQDRLLENGSTPCKQCDWSQISGFNWQKASPTRGPTTKMAYSIRPGKSPSKLGRQRRTYVRKTPGIFTAGPSSCNSPGVDSPGDTTVVEGLRPYYTLHLNGDVLFLCLDGGG